jgi:hypothetical protein
MSTTPNPRAEPHFPRYRLTGEQRAVISNAERALPKDRRRAFHALVARVLKASGARGTVADHLVRLAVTAVQRSGF